MHYIEGDKNILADNLSRLHRLVTPAQLAKGKPLVEPAAILDEEDANNAYFLDLKYSGIVDNNILDSFKCYLNLPDGDNPEYNPLSFCYIREQQQSDTKLLALQQK